MKSYYKVIVIAQYYPPDMGGASTRVSNVVKGLLSKGCEVKVVAAFPHYPHGKIPREYKYKAIVSEKVGGVKIFRVWIPALPHDSIVHRILLHISFVCTSLFALPFIGDVDIIWASNPNMFSFFPSVIYNIIKHKPIVRNVDDLWPEVFYEMGIVQSKSMRVFLDFLAKLSYIASAAITPISGGYKCKIIEKYSISEGKVHVVEVGVDSVEPFISEHVHYKEKSQFIVMYSGVLGVGYDFETVLKAAGYLSKYNDIIFLIRGVGELAQKIEKLIKDLNLRNVVLNTTFLSKVELSALLHSADAFILPMSSASSVDKGLPTKVFEYQAYGKPIICISNGEPARYIEAHKSGLVVKPSDPEVAAQAVLKLYNDRKLAKELGWNGWQYVSENLTSEKIGEKMYKVFTTTQINDMAKID